MTMFRIIPKRLFMVMLMALQTLVIGPSLAQDSEIAFTNCESNDLVVGTAQGCSIYTADVELSHIEALGVSGYNVSWSPDGQQIVFDDDSGTLNVITVDSGQVEKITDSSVNATFAEWSPDGQFIAYLNRTNISPGSADSDTDLMLYDVKAGVSDRLGTANTRGANLRWSPQSTAIVYNSDHLDENHEIYVVDIEDKEITRLTDNAFVDRQPTWSPDGSQIAFSSDRTGLRQIFIMDADGGHVHQLVVTEDAATFPAWSPDGSQIAFQAGQENNRQIFISDLEGNLQQVTDDSADNLFPRWSTDGAHLSFERFSDGPAQLNVLELQTGDLKKTEGDNASWK